MIDYKLIKTDDVCQNMKNLYDIVTFLRDPKDGCPWDKEQMPRDIVRSMQGEIYEYVDALNENDKPHQREELGDVLLQVVFHCRIEEEQSSFKFDDVCDEVCKKLIIRHPHVFGDVTANTTDQVLKNWDAIKMETKGQERYTDTLTSVAKSLPALMRAQKVGKRAMRAGMDFRCAEDAVACINDETSELEAAIISGNKADIEEELGDLLFSCVNAARHLGIDAELALKSATEKFIKRFSVTEDLVSEKKLDMKNLPIEELDIYWDKAKSIISKMEEQKND